MLVELRVTDLGVIEELSLVLGPGMTAVTGETGAGKTLVVEAIDLLVGGRAEPHLVRPGAREAAVEGRFDDRGEEVVLRRVVPRDDRSRAYVDGRPATARTLAERGADLVDLHGQHGYQSLLASAPQRRALDLFAGVDLGPLVSARREVADIEESMAALGGDERARARELDLLGFQVAELDAAGVVDPDEDERLDAEESLLGDALAHRQAAAEAAALLSADSGAADLVAGAIGLVAGRSPLAAVEDRLRAVAADVGDLGTDLRALVEHIEDDPARLDAVRARRQELAGLRRKYGATLAEVLAAADEIRERLAALEGHDHRASELDDARGRAVAAVAAAEAVVGATRRAAAPRLADATLAHLVELALPKARLAVDVGPDPGDDVTFRLAANPGGPLLPLAQVASGGELARTMLALRLVLTAAPGTLVFDEVDAGVGGAAAIAVGRALAGLATDHQVLVVTHLPQVAAFADAQVAITKAEHHDRVSIGARLLDGADRVVELSRMLAGRPDSDRARGHAEELLAAAAHERGR